MYFPYRSIFPDYAVKTLILACQRLFLLLVIAHQNHELARYIRYHNDLYQRSWLLQNSMGNISWSSEKGLDLSCACATLGWSLVDLPLGGLQCVFSVLYQGDEKLVWSSLLGKRMPKLLQSTELLASSGGIRV